MSRITALVSYRRMLAAGGLAVLTLLACSEEQPASDVEGTSESSGGTSSGDGDASGGDATETGDGDASETGGATSSGGSGTTEPTHPEVDPGFGGAPPELGETATIHIVGDSTAAVFDATDERMGWGVRIGELFDETITIVNAARSGASSMSYYNEGRWDAVKANVEPGDYVFIQFGHNDEKAEDPMRYTDPETTYRTYLNVYIGESRQLGAIPVLLTPISRLQFKDGMIEDTHTDYPEAMMAVAEASGTPLIDMTTSTKSYFEAEGQLASLAYFPVGDKTHTNEEGALIVAGLVADGIVEIELPLSARLLP